MDRAAIIANTTKKLTGPVLASYVYWLLQEAKKAGIDTLFFLARDGFMLKIIADTLCKEDFPAIKCKYLYCSRVSAKSDLFPDYIKQEGVKEANVGIVDSGWMGSIQRDINCDNITGFYFGMFGKGFQNCGKYRPYLFSHKKRWWWRFGFNANVFESLCSADHGMCVGYKKEDGMIVPVLSSNSPDSKLQIQALCDFMRKFCKQKLLSQDEVKKHLWRFFHNPTKEEVEVYGQISFAYDQQEQSFYPLADKEDVSIIKLIGRHSKRPYYWPAGTAVLLGYPLIIIRISRWIIEVYRNGKLDLSQARVRMRSGEF